MRRLAQLLARASGRVSRRLGRGGGTSLPGVVLLRLRPNGLAELASRLPEGSALVSATNGKTTTARLLSACVRGSGRSVVANTAGANLASGVATALLDAGTVDHGVFEVDEAALPQVAAQTGPRCIVLMNLFRDQLDRYGELEVLAERWRQMVARLPESCSLVLNADDPTIASLAPVGRSITWFGVDDLEHTLERLPDAADALACGSCGSPLEYSAILLSHLGHWTCTGCGQSRPTPDVVVNRARLAGARGQSLSLDTPEGPLEATVALPGLHNAYNCAAAVAAAQALGLRREVIGPALESTAPAFGRAERIHLEGRDVVILLAKNPTGVNQNVRMLEAEPELDHLLVCLNDDTADGHDVSWIWDVDYEPLFARSGEYTVAGARAHDLALRFGYGGLAAERMTVLPEIAEALDHAIAGTPAGGTLFVLPTYTAMLALRRELVRRGVAEEFWRDG